MKDKIRAVIDESIRVKKDALDKNLAVIERAADAILKAFQSGRKVFLFGNGGSAADSQHIAAEFIGRFQKERRALPAIALTTDTSILTSLSNDYSYDIVFARQLEALGQSGDVAIGLSTSGNSANVLRAFEQAKKIGMTTVAFTGGAGGKMAALADLAIIVPSKVTARIQESHITIAHAICEVVEDAIAAEGK